MALVKSDVSAKYPNMPVLQVVGYQNSGKTTLITKMIKALQESHYRIGTIKHHGHDGSPLFDDTNKDTYKHRSSGAVVTGVSDKGRLQINHVAQNYLSLEKLLEIYRSFSLDFILIEGFKYDDFPKIVLLKTPQDEKLLNELRNIALIICWYLPFPKCNIPIFSIMDETGYISWIQLFLKEKM